MTLRVPRTHRMRGIITLQRNLLAALALPSWSQPPCPACALQSPLRRGASRMSSTGRPLPSCRRGRSRALRSSSGSPRPSCSGIWTCWTSRSRPPSTSLAALPSWVRRARCCRTRSQVGCAPRQTPRCKRARPPPQKCPPPPRAGPTVRLTGVPEWSVEYDQLTVVIWVSTAVADYKLLAPAAPYEPFWQVLQRKTALAARAIALLIENPALTLKQLRGQIIKLKCAAEPLDSPGRAALPSRPLTPPPPPLCRGAARSTARSSSIRTSF